MYGHTSSASSDSSSSTVLPMMRPSRRAFANAFRSTRQAGRRSFKFAVAFVDEIVRVVLSLAPRTFFAAAGARTAGGFHLGIFPLRPDGTAGPLALASRLLGLEKRGRISRFRSEPGLEVGARARVQCRTPDCADPLDTT